ALATESVQATVRVSEASARRGRSGERLDAPVGALGGVEEVPHLDDVPLRVLDIQRAVAALVADRAAMGDVELLQPPRERGQAAGRRGEREVDVAAALVAELLLPGEPEPETGARPDREPDAVLLAREDAAAEGGA